MPFRRGKTFTIWARRGALLGRGRDAGACGEPAAADLHPDAGVRGLVSLNGR
ncbi:hypothetical protein GCM10010472_37760 [Pseudonocardia halophobica]|uniref:Uncharacterized protein n=1 Tax=Pseudonocardia halophobica TaxID=29401 RepID=A0A9W6L5N2_9PSEU|nr:hypothetical protein [Pseudonocardia halophobica]GLL14102.1 hypothetical protein GCM10017577_52480 [Pseudonocardia halophobica]